MARLPPFQSRERIALALCASNLDQRMLGRATRWLHARRLPRLFLVLRRPRRITETVVFMAYRQLEQRLKRPRVSIDALVHVAQASEARRHRR